jgi:thiol peroxidase
MATVTLRGNPLTTSGEIPAAGSTAPDFRLTGLDLKDISLGNVAGSKTVLNIFPSVDTATCAASVRRFNAEIGNFPGAKVLCISRDLPFALKRFCGAEGLDHVQPVSELRDLSFGAAYGLRLLDGPMAGLLARAVVVIDGAGKVLHSELVPEIAQEPNYEAALAALKD